MPSSIAGLGSQFLNLLSQPGVASSNTAQEQLAKIVGDRVLGGQKYYHRAAEHRLASFAANYAMERDSVGARLPSADLLETLRGAGMDYRSFAKVAAQMRQAGELRGSDVGTKTPEVALGVTPPAVVAVATPAGPVFETPTSQVRDTGEPADTTQQQAIQQNDSSAPAAGEGVAAAVAETPAAASLTAPSATSLDEQLRAILAVGQPSSQSLNITQVESGLFALSTRRLQQDGTLSAETSEGLRYNVRQDGSLTNIGVLSAGQADSGRSSEIEYDPARAVSEDLVIRLNGYASSATVDIGRFYNNESGGGRERGQYLLYRGETLIGVNSFEADNSSGNQQLTLDAGPAGVFDRIVFRSLSYGKNSGNGGQQAEREGRDSSDFSIDSVRAEVLDVATTDAVAVLLGASAERRQDLLMQQAQYETAAINVLQSAGSGVQFQARLLQADGTLSDANAENIATVVDGAWGSGIGVAGQTNRFAALTGELGYDPVSKLSEQMVIDFARLARSATINLGAFYGQEMGVSSERGQYEIYRGDQLVGVGIFTADGTTGQYTLNLTTDEDDQQDPLAGLFDRVVLSALSYGGQANAAETLGLDSSDFLVNGLTVDWLDQASSTTMSGIN